MLATSKQVNQHLRKMVLKAKSCITEVAAGDHLLFSSSSATCAFEVSRVGSRPCHILPLECMIDSIARFSYLGLKKDRLALKKWCMSLLCDPPF